MTIKPEMLNGGPVLLIFAVAVRLSAFTMV